MYWKMNESAIYFWGFYLFNFCGMYFMNLKTQ